MDQVQDHTHIAQVPPYGWNNLDIGKIQAPTRGSDTKSTGVMNSGRSGEETRVKNISIKLWQRIF